MNIITYLHLAYLCCEPCYELFDLRICVAAIYLPLTCVAAIYLSLTCVSVYCVAAIYLVFPISICMVAIYLEFMTYLIFELISVYCVDVC